MSSSPTTTKWERGKSLTNHPLLGVSADAHSFALMVTGSSKEQTLRFVTSLLGKVSFHDDGSNILVVKIRNRRRGISIQTDACVPQAFGAFDDAYRRVAGVVFVHDAANKDSASVFHRTRRLITRCKSGLNHSWKMSIVVMEPESQDAADTVSSNLLANSRRDALLLGESFDCHVHVLNESKDDQPELGVVSHLVERLLERRDAEHKTDSQSVTSTDLLLVGDMWSGKTCFAHRLAEGTFNARYVSTVEPRLYRKVVTLDDELYELKVLDTPSTDWELTREALAGARGAIVCCSFMSAASLARAEVLHNMIEHLNAGRFPVLLLATGADALEPRFRPADVQAVAKRLGTFYGCVSNADPKLDVAAVLHDFIVKGVVGQVLPQAQAEDAHQGELMFHKGKRWKKVQCAITPEGSLTITQAVSLTMNVAPVPPVAKPSKVFSLSGAKACPEMSTSKGVAFPFSVSLSSGKTLDFAAMSEADRSSWVQVLGQCIARTSGSSRKGSSGPASPSSPTASMLTHLARPRRRGSFFKRKG